MNRFIITYHVLILRHILFVLIAFIGYTNSIDAQASAVPDTPAGKQLVAWLRAFNNEKPDAIREFVSARFDKTLPAEEIAENHIGLFKNDGRFEIQKIVLSTPETIIANVKAHPTGFWLELKISIDTKAPEIIKDFRYRHIESPPDMLPRQKLSEGEIERNINALMKNLVAADRFSGAVLVAKGGKAIYAKAFGPASLAWNMPNRLETRFNIASLNKMFTSVAIAGLVEQGKLSYSDTVGKILPEYANRDVAQKVTIHHLLTHSSGLRSRSAGQFSRRFRKLNDYLPSFINESLSFEPGAKYEYSNDGYLLLGLIIEKVSGQDYFTYIRDHLYKPAGMKNSDSYDLDSDPPNIATGYMDGPNNTRRSNIFTLPVKGTAFGLGYSTLGDLQRFSDALRNHVLLTKQSTETVWAEKISNGIDSHYGYGFDVKRYNGARVVGHTGGWAGVTNQMEIYPDLGYTVVILSNYDSQPRPIAMKLREWITQGD